MVDFRTTVRGNQQEATKAKAEALTARLAREVQEAALEELGRLLEVTRRGVTMPDVSTECGEGGDQALRSTGPVEWERSREEARRFAKIMVSFTQIERFVLGNKNVSGYSHRWSQRLTVVVIKLTRETHCKELTEGGVEGAACG